MEVASEAAAMRGEWKAGVLREQGGASEEK
jgi:hypothetical protein